MLAIKNNRENQIYDILTELQNQGKQLTLCKVSAHIRVKGNEEADKAAKQSIDMPGMTKTSPSSHNLAIRRTRNSEWQREWENSASKLHNI